MTDLVAAVPQPALPSRATVLPDGAPPRRWTGESGVLKDDPWTEARWGLIVAAIFFVGFLGWAAFARLNAAVYGSGQIVVSGNRQAVQHRDGGIVETMAVREGDTVRAGQVLLTLAGTETAANERAASGQSINVRAVQARLTAELAGLGSIRWPADFARLQGSDRADANQAMSLQNREFNARRQALEAQRRVLRQDKLQLNEQVNGIQRQITAAREQQRLIGEELAGVQTLANQGLVPLTRLRGLQRAQADLEGQIGSFTADIARAREASGQIDLRLASLDRDRIAEVAAQLREIETRLSDVTPRLQAYQGQLQRTAVRAPVGGRIVGLTVFNRGAVIAPGQNLMEIVPDSSNLVIESRISPADADNVVPGQRTEIRITAFPGTELPVIFGEVIDISADSFVDEQTGISYFKARVNVPPDQRAIITRYQGADALRPGLPAEVVIPLRKRTTLDYLIEPFTRSMWRSFREN